MKFPIILLPLVCGCLAPGLPASAQSFATLYSPTYLDGGPLTASLVLSGGVLYGTAESNGTNGVGTIFSLNTDGSGFTNLYTFTPLGAAGTNSDGAYPYAGLVLAGHTLYGTASRGGRGSGAVFKINTDGSGFTNLYSFSAITNSTTATNADGANPQGNLLVAGATLYGTAYSGGTLGNGTVFAINTNGAAFTNLHNFAAGDGTHPPGSLVMAGQMLYGVANNGGTYGAGAVFGLNTNGAGFTNLYSFTVPAGPHYTNVDGAFLGGGLVLANNVLYGTANSGGFAGKGTIFGVRTNGGGFSTLHSFSATFGAAATNSEGANPSASLFVAGKLLYGTAYAGGAAGCGTIFVLNTNGAGFTTLHDFPALVEDSNSDGANPEASLILSNNVLYGTTYQGGTYNYGAVFSLWLAPLLSMNAFGTNMVLTWPTNLAGFSAQYATNLASPAIWAPFSQAPVVMGTNNQLIDQALGAQRFYRLTQ